MNYFFSLFLLLSISNFGFSQVLESGQYGALQLAYDIENKLITGYYEDYTGWDANTESPRCSCTFYLEGKVFNGKVEINTYQPGYKLFHENKGVIEIIDDSSFSLSFNEPEKASCSNVVSFQETRRGDMAFQIIFL